MIPESDSAASSDVAGAAEATQVDGQTPGGGDGATSEEVAAAQAALERAGIALQEAGQAVNSAEGQAGMAEAEKALSDARVAVIVASEDLREAREAAGADEDGSWQEAKTALDEANQAIVTASRTVLSAGTEYPATTGRGSGGKGQLDEELDESLAIFEGKIQDARQDAIDSEPPPSEAGDPAGKTVAIGTSGGAQQTGSGEEGDQATESESEDGEQQQTGRMPGPGEVQTAGGPRQPPEDIPDGQDDDIVAQQLREAAMAETDPELREKLWEEYRRYKENISR
ncbi:MAG: hypothetical protein WD356_06205 [Pseudomonadales bacterium]